MTSINHITSIVKVLEFPTQRVIEDNILLTEFRVALPQIKNSQVVHLVLWGELTDKFLDYMQPNDFILIDGFVSLSKVENSKMTQIKVTVSKIYPLYLAFKPLFFSPSS